MSLQLASTTLTAGSMVNLTGGTLSVAQLDTGGTPSRFNWTAGTLAVTGAAGFNIAPGAPLGASITLNSGMSLQVAAMTTLGAGGVANLSGGTLSTSQLDTGATPSRLNWTGGTLAITGNSGFSVAPGAPLGASVTLNSGMSLQVSAKTTLAAGSVVNLSGGTLSTTQLDNGGTPSRLNWTSGTLNLTADGLNVDTASSSLLGSNVTLTGAESLSMSGNESVGNSGSGTFTQSGNQTIASELYCGVTAGATGTFNLSDLASLTVGGHEHVGLGGIGVFNQSGGTNNTAFLYIGKDVGAVGIYSLSNTGSLYIATDSGEEDVGYDGTGTFIQSGGTNFVPDLILGYDSGATGTYTLSSSGTLTNGIKLTRNSA
jgi:hypothetical protein